MGALPRSEALFRTPAGEFFVPSGIAATDLRTPFSMSGGASIPLSSTATQQASLNLSDFGPRMALLFEIIGATINGDDDTHLSLVAETLQLCGQNGQAILSIPIFPPTLTTLPAAATNVFITPPPVLTFEDLDNLAKMNGAGGFAMIGTPVRLIAIFRIKNSDGGAAHTSSFLVNGFFRLIRGV